MKESFLNRSMIRRHCLLRQGERLICLKAPEWSGGFLPPPSHTSVNGDIFIQYRAITPLNGTSLYKWGGESIWSQYRELLQASDLFSLLLFIFFVVIAYFILKCFQGAIARKRRKQQKGEYFNRFLKVPAISFSCFPSTFHDEFRFCVKSWMQM